MSSRGRSDGRAQSKKEKRGGGDACRARSVHEGVLKSRLNLNKQLQPNHSSTLLQPTARQTISLCNRIVTKVHIAMLVSHFHLECTVC